MAPEDALLAIQELMDGVEWNSDTTSAIADIVIQAGYKLHDLDGDPLNPSKDFVVDETSILNHPKSDIVRTIAEARGIPVIDMPLVPVTPEEFYEPAAAAASGSVAQDHKRIWLEPMAEDYDTYGRTWCQDKVWPEEEGQSEPTEYVRADIHQNEVLGLMKTMAAQAFKLGELKGVLKSLVNDIKSMQNQDGRDPSWFGEFSNYEEDYDEDTGIGTKVNIEWPNLAISCEAAEKLLKELECPSSSS